MSKESEKSVKGLGGICLVDRLDDYQVSQESMTISVRTTGSLRYRIQFIGKGGRVLLESPDPKATYTFNGDEGYVRAKVFESNGRMAWGQPYVIR